MRHRKSGRKLNMDSSARKAMFRNMVTSLMLHGQIRTTEARAKELRRFAERIISLGKNAPAVDGLEGDALQAARAARVHAMRQARRWINNDEAIERLFGEYAERFRARPGGYTRVVKAGRREGDNAPMAVIQLVEEMSEAQVRKPTEPAPEAPSADDEATVAMERPTDLEAPAELGKEE